MRPADIEHGFGVFPDRGLQLVDGDDVHVTTADGTQLLDAGGASYGTANVGHAHARVEAAIEDARKGLTHASRTFSHPQRARLVDELRHLVGPWAHRVFLANSGTEAIEAAIKTAMVQTGRSQLVAFERGFHGRSLGALAATHEPRYREPFADRLGETTFVPYGDTEALREALDEDVAAVLVEPIQGEGGVRLPPNGFLPEVIGCAREVGAISVVDEIQTGLGRTGAELAIHRDDLEPDLVTVAKSLAAGLPLAATISHERVGTLDRGQHGTTFGGNPVACRVAREVLAILEEENLAGRARRQGDRLADALSALDHPLLGEVRGRGLMIGLELSVRPTTVLQALQREGVLALPGGGSALRLLPPLTVRYCHLREIVDGIAASLDRVADRYARRTSA
jgi:acetylornithine/LysW-gamma-L-lysine aminotransferase